MFGPVTALQDVSMRLTEGEVTALVGDNGAGKSTLVKMISGVLPPSVGTIQFDGADMVFGNPAQAREAGIETVYQDLALAGNMPVWANIFLGRELVRGPLRLLDKKAMAERAREMLAQFNMNVPPINGTVDALSGGQRQLIAIARAAAWGSRLIIMDEPTAALGVAETRAVESVIQTLKARGFSVLIISHNLDQVFRLSDRIWVLRRGSMVGERRTASTHANEIVSLITGAAATASEGRP
ncbi:MAG: sugar ABC transporter ATP-binding protein [Chloroflexi bacterium]|nr:sugar ABC transporter ATP-binding protein [Chloroflexota bacterium]